MAFFSNIVSVFVRFILSVMPIYKAVKESGVVDNYLDIIREKYPRAIEIYEKLVEPNVDTNTMAAGSSVFIGKLLRESAELETTETLNPVEKAVLEAMQDGVISDKELVKIILAYELFMNNITKDTVCNIAASGLAGELGYKTPQAFSQQVTKTMNSFVKLTNE